uniref:Uncharacterized protein n=1 Tax=Ixodes ricinus TaxID=34613 RepID=A0A6B0U4I2_IXORI
MRRPCKARGIHVTLSAILLFRIRVARQASVNRAFRGVVGILGGLLAINMPSVRATACDKSECPLFHGGKQTPPQL